MRPIDLAEADASRIALVGGKAAGLGEMIKAGERVPAGFCLTTEAYLAGRIPEAELLAAYRALGGGPVAVRSSATAEDLPDASFAGQQDTYLGVRGEEALLEAVRNCWASLHTERAVAYREGAGVGEDDIAMAVVVQRMVDAEVAGVLFTANPITGTRTEMVVDAAPGLGTTVVDGSAETDHYVLDGSPAAGHGCLTAERLEELRRAGTRLERHFGTPQDAEWAYDADGTLWLLQSRAITTLFPLPPETDKPKPRVYFEFGHIEGLLRPMTPMGMSAFKAAMGGFGHALGARIDPVDGPAALVDVGGRLYLDVSDFMRDKSMRERVPDSLTMYGPRAAEALRGLLDDPRFAPVKRPARRIGPVLKATARYGPMLLAGTGQALLRPAAARASALRIVEEARRMAVPPTGTKSPKERIRFAQQVQADFLSGEILRWSAPIMVGMGCSRGPATLLKGIATDAELDSVLRGMPYNVTTEMDLELWRLARDASAHRDLLLGTPPEELARRYHAGELPDIGMARFLDAYGQRAAAEADVGMPRWSENPAPVFQVIANYLRITDPEQAPDRRFAEAAREAEAMIGELYRRARGRRPVRARLARFMMRRARALAGLRELGKFAWLYPLAAMRSQLLLAGAELAGQGLLDRPEDVMFLDLREAETVAGGADLRDRIAARRETYRRELRRRTVPALLLSDGTDLVAAAPAPPAEEGTLAGLGAAPGTATGRARVVLDPGAAHIEPGEILVAPTTDPGWTPLFMTAGGLVTETGSVVAHGPTVAREYGIPAVIGVARATHEIVTGQEITIDGATGRVTLGALPSAGATAETTVG